MRAAALFGPMVPLVAHERVELSSTSVFISAGRRDPICPPDQAEQLAGLLTERDASVEPMWHDGGHELSRPHPDAGRDWLSRWQAITATDRPGDP